MDVEGSEEREELEAYIEVAREAIAERRMQQTFIGGLCCGGGMMDHGGGMPVAWMWLGLCSAELPRDMVFISAAWGCA